MVKVTAKFLKISWLIDRRIISSFRVLVSYTMLWCLSYFEPAYLNLSESATEIGLSTITWKSTGFQKPVFLLVGYYFTKASHPAASAGRYIAIR